MALITVARATELIPNFNAADNSVMTDIVQAASDLIEKWCNRTFASTTYDELYDGQGTFNLLLDNYPVISIDRVMFSPTQVLLIRNTDTGVSRASFRLDGDASSPPVPNTLTLTSVKNGVVTTNTITIEGNNSILTYGDLATAINAFSADGWTAQALGIYGTWAVADVRPPQGGFECHWQGASYLYQHMWGVPAFNQNPEIGELVSPIGFDRGYQNYRVIYTAGFATVPTPVQQACAELAVAVYHNRDQNNNLQSENLGGYSYAAIAEKSFNNLSIASRYALYQYKNIRIPKFRITI
jgi:hypothetical protein